MRLERFLAERDEGSGGGRVVAAPGPIRAHNASEEG
jgi:hypothetical protein